MTFETAGAVASEDNEHRTDTPTQPQTTAPATDENESYAFWNAFGLVDVAADGSAANLPENIIAYTSDTVNEEAALLSVVKALPFPPALVTVTGGISQYFYRVGINSDHPETSTLPPGVKLHRSGDRIKLPIGECFTPHRYGITSINQMAELKSEVMPAPILPTPIRPEVRTPLSAFSLRGQATQFEETMVKAVPVLGDICLAGQSTVWYAAPNAGKTLIALRLLTEAVDEGRIPAGNAYYINADDGNEGFATKLRLLDDIGAHTLSPGFRNFRACDLSDLLREMATTNTATGTIVIVDTLKKFADLMHKRDASAFGDAARQYVMKGGTLLGLAHVNKNLGTNGKPSYAGVADIVQDADAAYMLIALDDLGDDKERVIQFDAFKLRGPGIGKVAYAYASEDGLSYHERLASVRIVDPQQFEEFERYQAEKSDSGIIAAISACISEGIVQKMALAKAAATRAHVPERAAIRAIETYTGDDPAQHHWTYKVRERGAKVFELLVKPEIEPLQNAA